MDQSQSAAEEPNGIIIAGQGFDEKTFYIPLSALQKSPVIRGWMEDPVSIPASLLKGNALHFPFCDPDVVSQVIGYLNSETKGTMATIDSSAGKNKDVLFYVKMYKLALCLGLDELCLVSLSMIQNLTQDTETFLRVISVSMEEKTSLVDHHLFREWMMSYLAKKSEVLTESALFKGEIVKNKELAWKLCFLFISSLARTNNGPRADHMPRTTSSSVQTRSDNLPFLDTPPATDRRTTPYLYHPQQESPCLKRGINQIQNSKKDAGKMYGSTVEDAGDEE